MGTTTRHATLSEFSAYCHSAVIADSTKNVKGEIIYNATVQIDDKALSLEHSL